LLTKRRDGPSGAALRSLRVLGPCKARWRHLSNESHHIHVVEGHFAEHWGRLLFRDYLVDHPEVAKEYEGLKVRLASVSTPDRVAYTRGKTKFIAKVTEQAKRYYGRA